MMERAAVAIRTIATAPTDESDATATLGALQQTREQIAPWADNKSGRFDQPFSLQIMNKLPSPPAREIEM